MTGAPHPGFPWRHSTMDNSFDIIVFGFTGRLVAEYLHQTYGVNGAVSASICPWR